MPMSCTLLFCWIHEIHADKGSTTAYFICKQNMLFLYFAKCQGHQYRVTLHFPAPCHAHSQACFDRAAGISRRLGSETSCRRHLSLTLSYSSTLSPSGRCFPSHSSILRDFRPCLAGQAAHQQSLQRH